MAQTNQFGGFLCYWFSLFQVQGRGILVVVESFIFFFVSGGHVVLAPVASALLSLFQWPCRAVGVVSTFLYEKHPLFCISLLLILLLSIFLCHCCVHVNCLCLPNSEVLVFVILSTEGNGEGKCLSGVEFPAELTPQQTYNCKHM